MTSVLARKIVTAIIIISTFASLLTTALHLLFEYSSDIDNLNADVIRIAQRNHDALAKSIWDLNDDQRDAIIKGLLETPGIEDVMFISTDSNLNNHNQTFTREIEHGYLSISITYNEDSNLQKLGSLFLKPSIAKVRQGLLPKAMSLIILNTVKAFAVSMLILIFINASVANRLAQTEDFVKGRSPETRLNRGILNLLPSFFSKPDELDQLHMEILDRTTKLNEVVMRLDSFNRSLETEVKTQTEIAVSHQHKLETASRLNALGEIAAGVAHEINNPLAVIQGKADLLLKRLENGNADPEKIKESLNLIVMTCQRIAKLTKSMTTLARDGTNEKDLAEFTLQQLMDDVLPLVEDKMRRSETELHLKIEGPNCTIFGVRVGLAQIIINLVNNASDAIENLDKRWIEIFATGDDHTIIVTVTDSGSGIPKDVQEKMFQPFFTTKEVGKGTGLGLAIIRKIIEMHRGELSIDNACKNTRFVVRLPRNIEKINDYKDAV